MNRLILRSLVVDSRRRSDRAAEEIGACLKLTLGNPDLPGAYTMLKWRYFRVTVRYTNPLWADMANVAGDYTTLNQREDPKPPGRPVTTQVTPFRINADVPL